MSNLIIAADSSTIIAFLKGSKGSDIEQFSHHLQDYSVLLPPPVVLEVLSNHATRDHVSLMVKGLRQLEIQDGFWERASLLRATILKKGLKARIADTMIAQCCIDNRAALITRDADFKHFAKHGGLRLV